MHAAITPNTLLEDTLGLEEGPLSKLPLHWLPKRYPTCVSSPSTARITDNSAGKPDQEIERVVPVNPIYNVGAHQSSNRNRCTEG